MNKRYSKVIEKLNNKEIVILDGAMGTELEKRGVQMDETWSGSASLKTEILKKIHIDYIKAGAEIITTNTYPSNRIMLDAAGLGSKFEEINLKAINAAVEARIETDRDDVLIAGSLSHRFPIAHGDLQSNPAIFVSKSHLKGVCDEMSEILSQNGCDFILLEMMYHPERIKTVFDSAKKTNKPIWASFSARKSPEGKLFSFTDQVDLPFKELIQIVHDYNIDAVGINHTSLDIISEAISEIKKVYDGPIIVYPDTGGWISPNWIFDHVIKPKELRKKALQWVKEGAQIIGGCCGTSPNHIKELSKLKITK
jgi:homocysteine S-methyltransferase